MGSAYYDWDAAWAAVDYNTGTDWTSLNITDEEEQVSDAMSLDGKAGCEISVTVVTGAVTPDGNVYVYLLRDVDGTNYEGFTADDDNDSPALLGVIVPGNGKTRRKTFFVDAGQVSAFKIAVDNDSGQTQATSVKVRYCILTTA